jgi:TRAP-type mannitol/chloroaromatic compound transport system substrate-binding protein
MFEFGSTDQLKDLYSENALAVTGPALPDVPLDEMAKQDLRNALSYARIAYDTAEQQGASEGVLRALLEQYDEVFALLASVSESFRDIVRNGRHIYLGGYSSGNIAKYKGLAGV